MPRKLPTLDTDDLIARYRAGASLDDLACDFGIGRSSVHRLLRATGVEMRPKAPTQSTLDAEEVVRLYQSGIGARGIGQRLGCAARPIIAILQARGVPIRNRSGQQLARMSRLTREERQALAQKAHEAARRPHTEEERAKMALTRHLRRTHVSPAEALLAQFLEQRGLSPIIQAPVGRYNCDLVVGPVAVEVFGGAWHWHGRHLLISEDRFRYIMNAGFHALMIVADKRHPIDAGVADYVQAFVQEASRDPTATRQYRVVRGAGELLAAGRADDDHISIIPTLKAARDPRTGRYTTVRD